jgi:hypothetical protein
VIKYPKKSKTPQPLLKIIVQIKLRKKVCSLLEVSLNPLTNLNKLGGNKRNKGSETKIDNFDHLESS